jgi:hypothetical protein
VQKLLQDPRVPAEARDGDLLALAGGQERRLLLGLGAAEYQDAVLVQKPVASERGRVRKRLFLLAIHDTFLATFALLIRIIVVEASPTFTNVSHIVPLSWASGRVGDRNGSPPQGGMDGQ